MLALVDCNNFYASCERVFRPDLVGKPVVVLSNNDGCVIARSNEAKALDIPMGAPAFKFQEVFDANGVQVFSANFALYGDMSHRVMKTLEGFCRHMEVYSIDEAFMMIPDWQTHDLRASGLVMRQTVLRNTGIPISIGVAPNKTLAKVANRIAKKFPTETQGVHVIDTEALRIKALKWLPVGDIWGIGRQYSAKLTAMGVRTAYDLCRMSDDWIRHEMSVVELRLKKELCGEAMLSLDIPKPKQTIATTRSFHKDYTNLAEIKERVVTFAVNCAEKLRKQHSCCRALTVFVQSNGFRRDLPQYNRSTSVQLPFASNSGIELAKFAAAALERIFRDGISYKKAGVIVSDFVPETAQQLGLFENTDPRHAPLMRAIDACNHRIGQHKVKLAAQDPGRVWKMRQERLSPRYSTQLSEAIIVHVR